MSLYPSTYQKLQRMMTSTFLHRLQCFYQWKVAVCLYISIFVSSISECPQSTLHSLVPSISSRPCWSVLSVPYSTTCSCYLHLLYCPFDIQIQYIFDYVSSEEMWLRYCSFSKHHITVEKTSQNKLKFSISYKYLATFINNTK